MLLLLLLLLVVVVKSAVTVNLYLPLPNFRGAAAAVVVVEAIPPLLLTEAFLFRRHLATASLELGPAATT